AEATEEPMDEEEAEATEEPMDEEEAEATEEPMDEEEAEATEGPMDEMVEAIVYEDDAGFTFEYPGSYEQTVSVSGEAITLDMDDQRLIVISPTGYSNIVADPAEDAAENLALLVDRLGYNVGESADMSMAAASVNVELPRRGLVGFANLVDLGDGVFAVVLELAPEADAVPSEDGAAVADSMSFTPPPPEEEAVEEEDAEAEAPTLTIVGLALQADDLNTLATAVVRGGFITTLNGEGPFTVFAPTDVAFAEALELLELTAEELLADRELLRGVLSYHVVSGSVLSGDLEDGMEVETLNGATLLIGVSEDGVTIADSTDTTYNVVTADVLASNGVVHVIDGVLLPPPTE
ncbi:MAG: fasciclin domain-containing protein, partial [Anaerolineae bacterium]